MASMLLMCVVLSLLVAFAASARVAPQPPSGPNPGGDKVVEQLPSGGSKVVHSMEQPPSGPNPGGNSVHNKEFPELRDVPSGPNPIHNRDFPELREVLYWDEELRQVPSGPDPVHNWDDNLRQVPSGPDPFHN